MLPNRVFVGFYHIVSAQAPAHVKHLLECKSPDEFEKDLLYFKEHCYVASHEELLAHQSEKKSLPRRTAVLTFDDGYRECYEVVRPLLLKYRMPCTFFVCANMVDNKSLMFRNKVSLCIDATDKQSAMERHQSIEKFNERFGLRLRGRDSLREWLLGLTYRDTKRVGAACEVLGVDTEAYLRGKRPYMTRDEIVQLWRDGFTIGAHTCNHPELWLLPWLEAVREIVESCATVVDITGQEAVPFAIPFNGRTLSRDKLGDLWARNKHISLIFDTNNMKKERSFLVNRTDCDQRYGLTAGGSNIPQVMRRAYALEPLRMTKRLLERWVKRSQL
ncbi:MAG: polysaccharide deacetylase family protein [Gammaproteobacteria bacterium]|nr:polysaccharide deacetylase family protein [Gammaproteobacteria bacterium]NIR90089.1 polysaccharide deacetylase family protein [Gammaproteobacteria bacterium]NIU03294.1 polysaccharide deacetylase family protein [Gammaproteobacteria bacterium]NIV50788.1 polysaccharide deacetylase family protein [Gammaproteobacteria bacterium]NIV75373.1 polysaccharide deacetylase family protein [Gammaproteobacteria bacterium]